MGYAIMGAHKLQSTNVYSSDEGQELNDQINRLNEKADLSNHWPTPNDPEVQALLADESFEPIKYIETEVVDDATSIFVWKKDSQTGEDTPELDEEASTLAYKTAMIPERPTDVMVRMKKACEIVARRRSGH